MFEIILLNCTILENIWFGQSNLILKVFKNILSSMLKVVHEFMTEGILQSYIFLENKKHSKVHE